MSTPVHSLTMTNSGLSNVIISPIKVKNTFTNAIIETYGIWDTGATDSVITKSAAEELGLTTIRKAEVNGVHGKKEVNVYHVNLTLNNERISVDTLVTECEELSADRKISFLIGMNIINLGDFAITNFQGKTMMSFRIPSLQKIDFVEGSKNSVPYIKDKVPGRNDPCPCGSGKKFKNCHGR